MMHRRCLATLAVLLLAAGTANGCLIDTMQQYQELAPLVQAIEASGLAAALNDTSNVVTMFAPTDIAFQKLSLVVNQNVSSILSNADGLKVALGYHILSGAYTFDMFKHGLELPTLLPNASVVTSVIGSLQFAPGTYVTSKYGTPARILTPNVKSPDCLSLFHIIDEFLLSEETGPALGISWADNNTCNATVTA